MHSEGSGSSLSLTLRWIVILFPFCPPLWKVNMKMKTKGFERRDGLFTRLSGGENGLHSLCFSDGDGLSFLLGLVFFSMVVMIISLSSVWGLGSILKSHGTMMMMVVKGEEYQTFEEGLDLW